VEGFWSFLLTGDVPSKQETLDLVEDFKARRQLPQYVIDLLRALPRDTHPMTMFSSGILAMQRESQFAKRYEEGMGRMDYWEPMYEDCTNLLAKLPSLAAYIFRVQGRRPHPARRQSGLRG
jgi:citrate synthase